MRTMNEINEVIILAAGRSRRMEYLSNKNPKCLLPYKGETVLERLVRQIEENGVDKIYITTGYRADRIAEIFKNDSKVKTIENRLYEEDVNILSMSLALSCVEGPVAIFEADTVMEDELVKFVLGADFEGKSAWFTRGKFNDSQYGGILKSNKYGDITDIRIVSAYSEKFEKYTKLSGIMRVGGSEIELFKELVNKYAKTTIKQYFLSAWMENLELLPCVEADIENYKFFTFNKPEEYAQIQNIDIDKKEEAPGVELVDVSSLHGIEDYSGERVEELKKVIKECNKWTVPIVVSTRSMMVLDGQHRLESAKNLGYSKIPAVLVNYDDVQVWSLRKEIKVSQRIVERKIQSGEKFPYKTVKHKFGFDIPEVQYALDELV